MSTTYYKDNKEFTTRELVATYYKGISLPQGYDFTKDGAKIVFPTPKPTTTQLQQAVRNGVELDANGNTVQAWIVQDMFSDYINDEGVLVTKLEQEEAYMDRLEEDAIKAEAKLVETTIQKILDDSSVSRGYDNIVSECSYATSTGAFGAEAQKTVNWRDAVWTYVFQVQADVMAGTMPKPTLEELVDGLPIRGA